MSVAHVYTVAFQGIEAREVDVQVHVAPAGNVHFNVVGLGDKAVAESRERVRAALSAIGLALPHQRITVNLAPADLPKEGSHYDLPIALGLGAGAASRRPLGVCVAGGLLFSQVLTLYITPVIYLYMDRLNLWISKFGFASPPEGGGHRGARRDVMRRGNGMNNALSGLLRTAARRAGDSRRL